MLVVITMAYKCREEIVGKRFLSVSGFTKIKSGKISEWGWRAGVIRAATHKENTHPDLQVSYTEGFYKCQKGGVYLYPFKHLMSYFNLFTSFYQHP